MITPQGEANGLFLYTPKLEDNGTATCHFGIMGMQGWKRKKNKIDEPRGQWCHKVASFQITLFNLGV